MSDMEHLNEHWEIDPEHDRPISLRTKDDVEHYYTVQAIDHLPGDRRGIKTLQYVCDLHNAALDAKQAKHDDNAPPKGYRLATDEERRLYPYPEDCVMHKRLPRGTVWHISCDNFGWIYVDSYAYAVPESYQFIDRSDEADAKRMRHLCTTTPVYFKGERIRSFDEIRMKADAEMARRGEQ